MCSPDRVLPPKHLTNLKDEDFPSEFPRRVLINPVIKPSNDSRETVYFESCLSIPEHHALVPRHSSIDVESFDTEGNLHKFTASGWEARVIQHECVARPVMSCVSRF